MNEKGLTRELLCMRAAKEIQEGMYVNLGVGLPTYTANFIPDDLEVFLQSENGVLGYGGISDNEEEWDVDLVNAGAQPVVLRANSGPSFFHSVDAFTMIRGKHLDIVFLGGYQVSQQGDLANWTRTKEGLGGIGGAMDLAVGGAKKVYVIMTHTTKEGSPKILKQCTLPLTAPRAVDRIFTDFSVIDVTSKGLVLKEIAPGLTAREVQEATEPPLIMDEGLKEMAF